LLSDFDQDEDRLVILYGSEGDAAPDITLLPNPSVTGLVDIAVNGSVLAQLPAESAPALADVIVLTQGDGANLAL
jgi:hypothetical protein